MLCRLGFESRWIRSDLRSETGDSGQVVGGLERCQISRMNLNGMRGSIGRRISPLTLPHTKSPDNHVGLYGNLNGIGRGADGSVLEESARTFVGLGTLNPIERWQLFVCSGHFYLDNLQTTFCTFCSRCLSMGNNFKSD